MQAYNWYGELIKPSFAPPAYLFGPVWTVLYIIIATTFIFVFVQFFKKKVPLIFILPFILNLIFNFAFTPIQFGLRDNILAAVDIILVLITLIWLLVVSFRKYKWVGYANVPYFLWVSFATVLQISVTVLNF